MAKSQKPLFISLSFVIAMFTATMRYEPMSPSGITRLHCRVFGYSHLDEVTYLRPRFLTLFPYTHTYSVIEPSVDVIYVVLHTCNSVVV